jgi:hypothetical protein
MLRARWYIARELRDRWTRILLLKTSTARKYCREAQQTHACNTARPNGGGEQSGTTLSGYPEVTSFDSSIVSLKQRDLDDDAEYRFVSLDSMNNCNNSRDSSVRIVSVNLIEELFAESKTFIEQDRDLYQQNLITASTIIPPIHKDVIVSASALCILILLSL